MPQAVTHRDRVATLRPRLVRDAIVLGHSTVLARRSVEHGCYCIEKTDNNDLAALLSLAYEKRISRGDPILLSVLGAADVLLKSPERVDSFLAQLPEPSASGIAQLAQAERLLKVGTRPADIEGTLRHDRLGLCEAPAYADHLTLCEKGVVLGKGTVIAALDDAPGDTVGLAVRGREERILALLSVATNRAIDADMLARFEAVSRALRGGNVTLAAIHLAHAGLPPLAHSGAAKALGLAADELDRGTSPFDLMKGLDLLPVGIGYADWSPALCKYNFNPDAPRDDHGRWTTGGDSQSQPNDGRVQVADNRPFDTRNDASSTDSAQEKKWTNSAKITAYFDHAYQLIHDMALRLNVNEDWILGLSAHESSYLDDHNTNLRNPFGLTRGGGNNLSFDSYQDAVVYWDEHYGDVVRGAASAEDFLSRLQHGKRGAYNSEDPEWKQKILSTIVSVGHRKKAWLAERKD